MAGMVGFALAAGLVEEPGWRGVAQDSAAATLGILPSAVVLAALWSVWHLPLYFIDGSYQHGLGVGTAQFWVSMLIRVPLGVLLVWLITGGERAVVAAVTAHALGNTTGELIASDLAAMVAELSTTSLLAVVIAAWARTGATASDRA